MIDMNKKYIFFWGGIYSNWYEAQFMIDDTIYNCVEQYMMYQKAFLHDDKESMDYIMSTRNPRDQKKRGRQVLNWSDELWDQHKYRVVLKACYAKFTTHASLKSQLLDSGDATIVEASPFDQVWGIGLGEDHPDRFDESKWRGENLLGKVIMDVRDLIRIDIRNER